MIPSITESSISVNSLFRFLGLSPGPPNNLSIIVKVIEGSISKIELPLRGSILTIAKVEGLLTLLINSS